LWENSIQETTKIIQIKGDSENNMQHNDHVFLVTVSHGGKHPWTAMKQSEEIIFCADLMLNTDQVDVCIEYTHVYK